MPYCACPCMFLWACRGVSSAWPWFTQWVVKSSQSFCLPNKLWLEAADLHGRKPAELDLNLNKPRIEWERCTDSVWGVCTAVFFFGVFVLEVRCLWRHMLWQCVRKNVRARRCSVFPIVGIWSVCGEDYVFYFYIHAQKSDATMRASVCAGVCVSADHMPASLLYASAGFKCFFSSAWWQRVCCGHILIQ